ncbi:MAG TPA: bifunctional methylenetetrahydrofolate dehydrogenase/methenyltetrahydrofolate cyclohydrolase FolD [Bacteroidales bacterium]|nr:bifunctional methylenetetrahydrofolate dehydrogenase/methenyltetrahydrofolate cyclohydrolase FolD [Bacteroidales bacterium]
MQLIDGKKIAEDIRMEIKAEVAEMIDNHDRSPHLAAVIVGEDPASQTYVAGKEKACKSVGFMSSVYKLPVTTTERELLELINFLNQDPEIDGFIVQLPLPGHISEDKVIQAIDPVKDVDGFHPVNLGRMISGLPAYLPATPYGIVQLLERSGIETEGKHCVVLGRSNIVGTPVSILLSRKASPGNCTVTICHSKTRNIKEICATADIIIAAIGVEGFVTADMVKKDAVIIDVGIHRVPSAETNSGFKLKGDVLFDEVSKKCSYITPVPGGVGPMTITSLLQNTLKAHKKEIYG